MWSPNLAAGILIRKNITLNCFISLDEPRKTNLACRKLICIAFCTSQRTSINVTNQYNKEYSVASYRNLRSSWIKSDALSSPPNNLVSRVYMQPYANDVFFVYRIVVRKPIEQFARFRLNTCAPFSQKTLLESRRTHFWVNLQSLNRIMNDP